MTKNQGQISNQGFAWGFFRSEIPNRGSDHYPNHRPPAARLQGICRKCGLRFSRNAGARRKPRKTVPPSPHVLMGRGAGGEGNFALQNWRSRIVMSNPTPKSGLL